MAIITITSDFGNKDYHIGMLKGLLLRAIPDAQIIDITHQITAFDLVDATYQFRSAYKAFPENTIHIALVNGFEINDTIAAVNIDGYWCIFPDNRMASMVAKESITTGLTLPKSIDHNCSHILEKVAILARMINQQMIEELQETTLQTGQWLYPTLFANQINGLFIYIDQFGNGVTNIHRDDFDQIAMRRNYRVVVRNQIVRKIYDAIYDVDKGDIFAVFGMSGYLEFGMRAANAANLFGIKQFDSISIEFFD